MAVATIERPSWPYQPARGHDLQGRDLPGRAQPDQGPAQEAIGEMAWLLRDTRSSMLFEGKELRFEQIGADVVQERGEPLLLPFPCGLPYAFLRL